jgi:hypothetical protein
MQMIFQNHITIKPQTVMAALMAPAIQKDLHSIRACEHRQPLNNRTRQEMGFVRFQNHISTSTHGSISVNTGRWSAGCSVPTLERGNDRGYPNLQRKLSHLYGIKRHHTKNILTITMSRISFCAKRICKKQKARLQ